jgi:hypothetical protein
MNSATCGKRTPDCAERSSLQFGTAGLEHALIQRTMALADGIIGNYRMGLPNVREAQWTSARNALRRAVPVSPGNKPPLSPHFATARATCTASMVKRRNNGMKTLRRSAN